MSLSHLFRRPDPPASSLQQYAANARLYEFGDRFIVCSVAGIAETESATILQAHCGADALGSTVLKHLDEYRPETSPDLRDAKRRDWRAFQLSGAKSVKSFERDLWHVDLAVMNAAVLIWARPRLGAQDDLSAYASANRHDPAGVGEAVRKAVNAARVLREQGVV